MRVVAGVAAALLIVGLVILALRLDDSPPSPRAYEPVLPSATGGVGLEGAAAEKVAPVVGEPSPTSPTRVTPVPGSPSVATGDSTAPASAPPPRPVPPRPPSAVGSGVVTGIIFGGDGAPAMGARLRYLVPDATGGVRVIAGVSNGEGEFRLAAPPGSVGELEVTHRDHMDWVAPGITAGSEFFRIELSEGSGVDGFAREGDEPLADAILRLNGSDLVREARSGAEGEFRFRGLPSGEYQVSVTKVGAAADEAAGESVGGDVLPHEPVVFSVGELEIIEVQISVRVARKPERP